jgi:hypothetical protein
MITSLREFAEAVKEEHPQIGNRLIRKIENTQLPTLHVFQNVVAKPTNIRLIDVDTKVLAEQLTVYTQKLFLECKTSEFLKLNWASPYRRHKAPNICTMIEMARKVSQWVTSSIVESNTSENRIEILKKFIHVASELWSLYNVNTLVQIMTGLNNASVQQSWQQLDSHTKDKLIDLNDFVSSTSNYKMMRDSINYMSPPLIPNLDLYLIDLTFIENGNQAREIIPNAFNFRKNKIVYRVLHEIKSYQATRYTIEPDQNIQAAIENIV